MPKSYYMSSARIKRIEAESASKAINKTIKMLEAECGIRFPRVGTPSENREIMVKTIGGYFK